MGHRIPRWVIGFVGLAVVASLIAACGADPTATPRPTPTPDAAAVFQTEWDRLLAAAQAEGEVVTFISGSLGRSDLKDLLPRFEDKYGIKVIFSTGSSRTNADKVLAERVAGKYTLDVWMGGSGTANTRLLPAGALRPMKPLLIHPEVLDLSKWLDDQWVWLDIDTQQFLFAVPHTLEFTLRIELLCLIHVMRRRGVRALPPLHAGPRFNAVLMNEHQTH